ncbi:MAG: hypothetical protein O7D29_13230 [Gemmatimonadetes bacterium]|nr:hypothetical protein [Gemmatimonadota bacterium]
MAQFPVSTSGEQSIYAALELSKNRWLLAIQVGLRWSGEWLRTGAGTCWPVSEASKVPDPSSAAAARLPASRSRTESRRCRRGEWMPHIARHGAPGQMSRFAPIKLIPINQEPP